MKARLPGKTGEPGLLCRTDLICASCVGSFSAVIIGDVFFRSKIIPDGGFPVKRYKGQGRFDGGSAAKRFAACGDAGTPISRFRIY